MTEDRAQAQSITRRWPYISSAVAIALVVALGGLILIRGNLPLEFDAEWMDEVIENRSPILEVPSLLMNFLGGGWFATWLVPIGGIIVFLVLRRRWAAIYYGLALAISAGLVQLLKSLYERPRPEDILVTVDSGSFPSGHSANAATLAVVLGIILWRTWVWVAGAVYVVVMMLSRTYLGAHWISDTVGGLLLGAAVAVILWAPLASRLQQEAAGARRFG